jgi:hypothetical protein
MLWIFGGKMVQTFQSINQTMSPESFCYWLQGWLELSKATRVDAEPLEIIKRHLGYVFSQGHLPNSTSFTIHQGSQSQNMAVQTDGQGFLC